MKTPPDLLLSTHRYEVNQSIHADLDGSTRETETPL